MLHPVTSDSLCLDMTEGTDPPVSHICTVLTLIPSFSASALWVRFSLTLNL